MVWDDVKVAKDDFPSADWNAMVTDQKTRSKILAINSKLGSDCTGSDGEESRVLTLSNTELTVQSLVYVNGLLEAPANMTIVDNATGTTITFLREIYDTDVIIVYPYA